MADDKPIHIGRESYPPAVYPRILPQAVRIDTKPESDAIHLLDYWHVLVARRWSVIAIFFTVLAVTLIATFKQTPVYQAEATIQIDRENSNVLTFKDVYEVESTTDDTLQTQYKVLESRTLARKVIEQLHLERQPEFQELNSGFMGSYLKRMRELFEAPLKTDEPDELRPVIDEYLRRLSVTPVRQARLVSVSFESKDGKLAAEVINAHTAQFIEQNFQFKWDATQYASAFLEQQLDSLKAKLEKSEDALQAYSREKQILFTEEGRNTATERLQNLEEEFTKWDPLESTCRHASLSIL